MRKCKDWIDTYCEYMYDTEPPISYIRWSAISAVAAAMQRRIYVRLNDVTYPNMYIVLVGPNASRKGTAMRPAGRILRELGIPLSVEETSGAALVRQLKNAHEDALINGTIYGHNSLTIFSEELTVFLGSNQTSLMSALCQWYDCPDFWDKDTVGRGREPIRDIWVNILAATTPILLRSSLPQDAIGSGLTSRIISIYEPDQGKLVIFDIETPERKELRMMLTHDLEVIRSIYGEFKLGEGWMEEYAKWRIATYGKKPFRDYRFDGYFGRRPTHIIRLSMIVSMSRSNELVLTAQDFNRALQFLEEAEIKMPQTFSGLGESPVAKIMPRLMECIAVKEKVAFSELMKLFYFDADKDTLNKCIDTLCGMKFCKRLFTKDDTIINYEKEE